jgi:hypothetical protein
VIEGFVMKATNFGMKTWAAGLLVGFVSLAQAGMIIDSSPLVIPVVPSPAIPVAPVVVVPTITHVGTMSTNVKRITTSANKQSVAMVLSKLVPKGWSGYAADPSIKDVVNVSYVGGNRPWPVVLEEVLKEHGLVATINWEKSEISVGISAQGAR